MRWERVVLLCEDRAHEQFLMGISTHMGWKIVDRHVCPMGEEAGSGWVLKQLPQRLQELRTGGYAGLGLLVAVDGDNVGRSGRMAALGQKCEDDHMARPRPHDPLAVLVPTWSIDTWALYFHKNLVIVEGQKSKAKAHNLFRPPHPGFLAPGANAKIAPKFWKSEPLKKLVEGFLGAKSHPELPSLDSSRKDLARWYS